MHFDRSRHRGGVAFYIKNDLIYNILPAICCELKIFSYYFLEILLLKPPNPKPLIVGTIYRPPPLHPPAPPTPSQDNFLF